MIGYVTLGTNDLTRAATFYDALFAELGVERMMETSQFVAWNGLSKNGAGVAVTKPYDGQQATIGNGVMVALQMESPAQVDKMYKKAIELGATCEGPAGAREGGFYAGYFRDPDGNKLNFFHMTFPE